MKNYFNYNEYLKSIEGDGFRKAYKNLFEKNGITTDLVYRNVIVLCKTEYFEKLGRKNFPQKATKTDFYIYDLKHYLNCITGILFFHDRVKKSYTKYGYIPSTTSCINPTGDTKVKRSYDYIDLEKIYNLGGYREKSILEDLKSVDFWDSDPLQSDCIEFFNSENNSFAYSISRNAIIG